MCHVDTEDIRSLLNLFESGGKHLGLAIRHRWHYGVFEKTPCGSLSSMMVQVIQPINEAEVARQSAANVLFADAITQYGEPSESVVCYFDGDVGDFLPLAHDFFEFTCSTLKRAHDHPCHREGNTDTSGHGCTCDHSHDQSHGHHAYCDQSHDLK